MGFYFDLTPHHNYTFCLRNYISRVLWWCGHVIVRLCSAVIADWRRHLKQVWRLWRERIFSTIGDYEPWKRNLSVPANVHHDRDNIQMSFLKPLYCFNFFLFLKAAILSHFCARWPYIILFMTISLFLSCTIILESFPNWYSICKFIISSYLLQIFQKGCTLFKTVSVKLGIAGKRLIFGFYLHLEATVSLHPFSTHLSKN